MRCFAPTPGEKEEIKAKWTCVRGNSWVDLSLSQSVWASGAKVIKEGMVVGEYPLGVDGKSDGFGAGVSRSGVRLRGRFR